MPDKKRNNLQQIILLVLCALVVLGIAEYVFTVINGKLFLEDIVRSEIAENIKAYDYKPNTEGVHGPEEIAVDWPWYSFLLVNLLMSILYFGFGSLSAVKFKLEKVLPALAVPLIVSILYLDAFVPLYLLATFIGYKVGVKKEKALAA